jgi:hypothetical protein
MFEMQAEEGAEMTAAESDVAGGDQSLRELDPGARIERVFSEAVLEAFRVLVGPCGRRERGDERCADDQGERPDSSYHGPSVDRDVGAGHRGEAVTKGERGSNRGATA